MKVRWAEYETPRQYWQILPSKFCDLVTAALSVMCLLPMYVLWMAHISTIICCHLRGFYCITKLYSLIIVGAHKQLAKSHWLAVTKVSPCPNVLLWPNPKYYTTEPY